MSMASPSVRYEKQRKPTLKFQTRQNVIQTTDETPSQMTTHFLFEQIVFPPDDATK